MGNTMLLESCCTKAGNNKPDEEDEYVSILSYQQQNNINIKFN